MGDPRQQLRQQPADLIRDHIEAVLLVHADDTRRRKTEIQALEAQGHRIVSGGQVDQNSWEIRDWRTDQLLAQGDDGREGYDDTTDRLNPDDMWVHIDNVREEPPPLPVTPGIPQSLGDLLADWVETLGVTDLEIASFIGWSEDKVRAHRSEL
ncbi:hypothetical protein [Amycolatopsis magusensis]|uniref:hypothetical protein n=1 Tax=Amycolatopsis magusensis TaxID=882444 RepID=UPI0037BBE286